MPPSVRPPSMLGLPSPGGQQCADPGTPPFPTTRDPEADPTTITRTEQRDSHAPDQLLLRATWSMIEMTLCVNRFRCTSGITCGITSWCPPRRTPWPFSVLLLATATDGSPGLPDWPPRKSLFTWGRLLLTLQTSSPFISSHHLFFFQSFSSKSFRPSSIPSCPVLEFSCCASRMTRSLAGWAGVRHGTSARDKTQSYCCRMQDGKSHEEVV